jgi:hypothetical protein
LRTYIQVIASIVAVAGGLLALVQAIHPFTPRRDAKLEIVDLAVVDEPGVSRLKIKLRNTGGAVAFLKAADLVLDDPVVTPLEGQYAGEVVPVRYDWLITPTDVANKQTTLDLSRQIGPDDVDALELSISFEKLRARLETTAHVRLRYNSGGLVTSDMIHIVADNAVSRMPVLRSVSDEAELLRRLEHAPAYALAQGIEQLTERRIETAGPLVQKALVNDDRRVRAAAAGYFGNVKSEPAVPALVNTALHDTDSEVRARAAAALPAQDGPAVAELGRALKTEDAAERELTVFILGTLPGPASTALLLKELDDRGTAKVVFGEPVLVSAAAIRAISDRGEPIAQERILAALHDENRSMLLAAIDAVEKLKLTAAAAQLENLAASPDAPTSQRATAALHRIGK